MQTELASRSATYQDVLDAPEHMVAQVLAGKLHLHPRPTGAHTLAQGRTYGQIQPPFDRALGGPGGWTIVTEPEIHLSFDIVVPDIAGWLHTTVDDMPKDLVYFEVRPDWICEVLSSSTEKVDRTLKLPLYTREGVMDVWLIDPRTRTLEVLRRESGGWTNVGTFCDDQRMHAAPFEAIEFNLAELWSWKR